MNVYSLQHDALDAARMASATVLGVVTAEPDWLKFAIAAATLLYMVGKACLVWLHFWKEKKNEKVNPEQDD